MDADVRRCRPVERKDEVAGVLVQVGVCLPSLVLLTDALQNVGSDVDLFRDEV